MNALPTAVFLDRDGTIIEDRHYLANPDEVKLVEGAAEAIARINSLLVPVVVVTNQSGIGRGYFTVEQHRAVTRKLDDLLAEKGARLDASYFCPHAPGDGCDCRKPGTLLFRRAAEENPAIDLTRALYIGDRMRDIEPGLRLGGDAVLVPSASSPAEDVKTAEDSARVAPSLGTAIDWFLCNN